MQHVSATTPPEPAAPAQEKLERQREHFNAVADRYAQARRHENHLLLKELMWRHFFALAPLPTDRTLNVLEAMCGYGDGKHILEKYAGARLTYHGFDYSDRVVETVQQTQPGWDVWQADATTYLPEPGEYDLIILLGGLHHVPDAAPQVVRNLAPGLRPGGLFINLEPTHGNMLTRRVRERIYRRNALFDEQTERAFAVSDLEAMFTGASLEKVAMTHPGLLSYVLYYNPDAFPRLNLGGVRAVRAAFAVDRPFFRSPIGRAAAFATLSMWRRPDGPIG